MRVVGISSVYLIVPFVTFATFVQVTKDLATEKVTVLWSSRWNEGIEPLRAVVGQGCIYLLACASKAWRVSLCLLHPVALSMLRIAMRTG